jgi:hypothetical protein
MHGVQERPRTGPHSLAGLDGSGSRSKDGTHQSVRILTRRRRMSYRMKITVPDNTATQLEALAEQRGEPVARVATRMIETALAGGESPQRSVASVAQRPPATSVPDQRSPWLEPYGGDRGWRALMWGSIVALHGRYPHALAFLKVGGGKMPRIWRLSARSSCGAIGSMTTEMIRGTSWRFSRSSRTSDVRFGRRVEASARLGRPALRPIAGRGSRSVRDT